MKKYLWVAVLPLAMSAQEVIAQAGPEATGARVHKIRIEAEARHTVGQAGAVQFISTEMGRSAVVKNAPYSAEAVTETVQTLADGNRITRKNSVTQYRDGEGRTRREFELQSLGRLGDVESGAHKSIMIDDPVGKAHYSLDVATKTAVKMPGGDAMFNLAMSPGASGFTAAGPGTAVVMTRTFERTASGIGALATENIESTIPSSATRITRSSKASAAAREEDLGSRNIEGVVAKGTRSTVTIAAGEVGNERPIEVVAEQWYSEQLKTYVLTRHSDPRAGETTLRLTNIRLGEPSATLFEVPADFTVKDASAAMQMMRKRVEEKRQE